MERKIVIAAIVSTEYLKAARQYIDISKFESQVGRLLIQWVLEYYDKFRTAPARDIQQIYDEKLLAGNIQKELAQEIEEDILPDLNEEYIEEGVNVPYMVEKTVKWTQQQGLEILKEQLEDAIGTGNVEQAQHLISEFRNISEMEDELVLDGDNWEEIEERIELAFTQTNDSVLWYPGALGKIWNEQLVRESFFAMEAPSKRGKTFMLLDMAVRGARQGSKVAFFQAGDMSEAAQIRRLGIYLCKKSDKKQYSGEQYLPVRDCVLNQLDMCDKKERECDHGVFDDEFDEESLKKEVTFEDLKLAYDSEKDYIPCRNCVDWERKNLGTAWLKKINIKNTLGHKEAAKAVQELFQKRKKSLRFSTHSNTSLSVKKMEGILNQWHNRDGYEPDIIIVDYADLLMPETKEFRHGQNEIWKGLRKMSQERKCLVITVTQTDAASFEQNTISLRNYSEDKRKYDHVTAMYGLSQDKKGREKKIGLLRVNELLLREGELEVGRHVTVLQKLQIGRPFIGSYF